MQTKGEKAEQIFKSRMLFERNVLNVSHDEDRAEVVHLLAVYSVRDVLKEHLNFLYIEKIEDFTLQHILNILFREIANEWVDYAMVDLGFSKDDAIEELVHPKRVKFIKQLSNDYYRHFKSCIFEEIADSFIELLSENAIEDTRSRLINATINSGLIPNRSLVNVNSSDQLCLCALKAVETKEEKLNSLKNTIKEIENKIASPSTPRAKKEDLLLLLPKYKIKIGKLEKLKLENFDKTLQVLKRVLVNSLTQKDIKRKLK